MENILEIKQRAILVGINTGDDVFFHYQMTEMENLCLASGIEVIDAMTQNLSTPHPATYVGSGKLADIALQKNVLEADLIVFNDELSPVQLRNITAAIDCEILDRTMLILEIFQKRAKTKEAALQVEIAHLNYMLPRLIGARTNLSRTGGGGGGGGGARRGGGETKLELDRRHIEKRISKAKEDLKAVVQARKTSRKARMNNGMKTVAFVGYTNAGKSSTVNSLLSLYQNSDEKLVFEKDMLFATLETSTRRVQLPNNHAFLITDTVGFVSNLPHHLVESFKSTLEEITEAHLIVHVIDASSPYLALQMQTTNQVLNELGVQNIPVVYAYNKMDLVPNQMFLTNILQPAVFLSHVMQTGYEKLIVYIEEYLFPHIQNYQFLLPFERGDLYSLLKETAEILSTEYTEHGILINVNLEPKMADKYDGYLKK